MNLKTLMIIKAVICITFGCLLLLVPGFTYSLFGISLDNAGVFVAREYGAALIGALCLTWYARSAVESQARRAIILDLFIYDAIGVIITLIALFSGLFNLLGWALLVIYLFFAVGFGYFWFVKPSPQPSQA